MTEIETGFDPVKGIIYNKRAAGILHLDDMLEELSLLNNNKTLPRNLKVLEDARDTIVSFSAKEIPILIKKLENVLEDFGSIRHAVVQKEAKNAAYTILVEEFMKNKMYSIKVFSTVHAATIWIER